MRPLPAVSMLPTSIVTVHDFAAAIDVVLAFYEKHPDETLIIVTADHETGGPAIGDGQEWKSDYIDWEILEKSWNDSSL